MKQIRSDIVNTYFGRFVAGTLIGILFTEVFFLMTMGELMIQLSNPIGIIIIAPIWCMAGVGIGFIIEYDNENK